MAATVAIYQSMKDLPKNAAPGRLCVIPKSGTGIRSSAAMFVYIPGPGWVVCGQASANEPF